MDGTQINTRPSRERNEIAELGFLLRSRFPILVVESPEEGRFVSLVEHTCNLEEIPLFTWSVVQGVRRHMRPEVFTETHELLDALKHLKGSPQNGVFVFSTPSHFSTTRFASG